MVTFLQNNCSDPKIEDAPSGAQNIDLEGKKFTFQKAEYPDKNFSIAVNEISGAVITKTFYYCADYAAVLKFGKKNTFTYTVEYKFNSKFEEKYFTTNTSVKTIEFGKYMEYRYNDISGDKRGYTGYNGNSWLKMVYTGNWNVEEKESDGFSAVTNLYFMQFNNLNQSYLAGSDNIPGVGLVYPQTFAGNYSVLENIFPLKKTLMEIIEAGEDDDGNELYAIHAIIGNVDSLTNENDDINNIFKYKADK